LHPERVADPAVRAQIAELTKGHATPAECRPGAGLS